MITVSMDSEGGIVFMKIRILSIALALMILLAPMAAQAGEMSVSPASRLYVSISALLPNGETQVFGPAVPVSDAPDEYRLWLTISPSAFFSGSLGLLVQDIWKGYADIQPANGSVLGSVADAGGNLEAPSVFITAYNEDGSVAAVFPLYISSQVMPIEEPEPTPEPTEAPTAAVTVRYLTENGDVVAPNTTKTVRYGSNTIYPEGEIPGDYELVSFGAQEVVLDQNGPHPAVVDFIYAQKKVTVSVTIHYSDISGNALAENTVFNFDAGEHPVSALPLEGYTVTEPSVQTVYVDKNGANPAEITFFYERAVQPAIVTVHYLNESGEALRNDDLLTFAKGTSNVLALAIPGYTLLSAEEQPVTVDENGVYPQEVTFVYRQDVRPVNVTVHYVDENGKQIAADTVQSVTPESSAVYPAGGVSPEDFELTGPEAAEVQVTADGAQPAEVTFQYARIVKPASVVLHYVDDLGNPIAEDSVVSVPGGESKVTPAASIDPALYALKEPSSYPVTVTLNGPSASEFTFTYQRLVQPVTVMLHYVDERGERIAPDSPVVLGEGTHKVQPAAEISSQDYTLTGSSAYSVTVTLDGASETDITFAYTRVVKPAQVTVHYRNEKGEPVAEDSVLTFEAGSTTAIALDIPNYRLLDGASPLQNVTVDADGAHPAEITFVYRAIPAQPAMIPVKYIDGENGLEIASRQMVSVSPGATAEIKAEPAPEDLLPNYTLASEPVVSVSVSAEGVSSVAEVVFRYAYVQPATEKPTEAPTPEPALAPTEQPAAEPTGIPQEQPTEAPETTGVPAQPVTLTVRYIDTEGKPVAQEGQVRCDVGDTLVPASPVDLLEGYVPEEPQVVLVHVDENGADPAEIIFLYRYTAEAPAPKVALVNVKYLDPNGDTFYSYSATCAEGQENLVSIDWENVDASLGYELDSPETVNVTVDNAGVADPAEVLFKFKNELNASVPIYYRDQVTGRDVAAPQEMLCYVGTNTIVADPFGLASGYVLSGPDSVSVTLTREGELKPAEVVFLYWLQATEAPAATAAPSEEAMDVPFYPIGASIRVRSSASTAEDNILGVVNSGDLGRIKGKVVTADGKVWYSVEINGLTGYMSEGVVRFLSDAELMALYNYTPVPTETPASAPTKSLNDAAIDRWGLTNARVNFRRKPSTDSDRIDSLAKNVRVWIYSSETVNGEVWYSVNSKGVNGYLKADFVDMLSEAESEKIQRSLVSPVPTQTPPATAEPTAEPTPAPTEVPTEAPTEAPTPEPTAEPPAETEAPVPTDTPEPPYQGFALTKNQVTALRTGVSMTDDAILQTLPPQTLLDVKAETYVDGVSWAYAKAVDSENWGYIPMSSLTKISNDEAKEYQRQIVATPEVTPTSAPVQVEGYAMTLGDGVPMRNYPDTNGEIIMLLPYTAVARVFGQQYAADAWHVVQYNGMWGFIRQDQLRMMSAEEVAAYEETMIGGTPSPSPAPTPEPVTQNSLSSYGHVMSNSGRVNLRSGPSTSSSALRLLDNYAFALVMGMETNGEGTWYHVSQGGTEGYIRSDYFHVLTLGELSTFLASEEYLSAASNNATDSAASSQILPVEDFNRNVLWQNPSLSVSYEPFNPYVTATPAAEVAAAATPAPTSTPEPSATPQIAPVGPTGNLPEPTVQQGGAPWPWILLGLAVVGCGGAYYAYTVNAQNKKRAALRAQQARQGSRNQPAAQQPQMRAAQNNPGQAGNPAAPAGNRPASNAAPTPARPAYPSKQMELAYLPPKRTGQNPAQAAFKPLMSDAKQPGVSGETKTYQTVSAGNPPTQVFEPIRSAPLSKRSIGLGDTSQWKPLNAPVQSAAQAPAAPKAAEPAATAPDQANAPAASEAAPRKRIRRTERYKDLYKDDQA